MPTACSSDESEAGVTRAFVNADAVSEGPALRAVGPPAATAPDARVGQLLDKATASATDGRRWQQAYRRRLTTVDAIVVITAVVLA